MNKEVKKYYNSSILKEACLNYGIDDSNVKFIQGNFNLIFDCGDKILRLSHSCIRSKKEIESELDWLLFLKAKGLPVVEILLSNTNEYLVKIGDDLNHFSCVCFKKINGRKVLDEEWNINHYRKLGHLTGMLHQEGQNYLEKKEIEYKHWNEIPEFKAWTYLPEDERDLLKLHTLLVDEFLTYPKLKSTYGLIHYDIHQSNYLLSGKEKELILLDFEMTCKSWYINDIASTLHYASHHPLSKQIANFDELFLDNFWLGYDQEYTLPKEERIKIPKFVLYRDLLVYGVLHKTFSRTEMSKQIESYFDSLTASIEKRRKELKICT